MSLLQELIGAYMGKKLQRVIYPICPGIFFQILRESQSMHALQDAGQRSYLIESADWCHEDDGRARRTVNFDRDIDSKNTPTRPQSMVPRYGAVREHRPHHIDAM